MKKIFLALIMLLALSGCGNSFEYTDEDISTIFEFFKTDKFLCDDEEMSFKYFQAGTEKEYHVFTDSIVHIIDGVETTYTYADGKVTGTKKDGQSETVNMTYEEYKEKYQGFYIEFSSFEYEEIETSIKGVHHYFNIKMNKDCKCLVYLPNMEKPIEFRELELVFRLDSTTDITRSAVTVYGTIEIGSTANVMIY